ncbi:MAG TPA: adenylate/guanylate cyclase domain-containing protein [Acidimicrobiales bacterium]|nr:adenylate/guanylate cyclase domain-containing protein [Acidimicrobiales bacterium]
MAGQVLARRVVDDDRAFVVPGAVAQLIRPMMASTMIDAVRAGALLYVLSGLAAAPAFTTWVDVEGTNEVVLAVLGAVALVTGFVLLRMTAEATVEQMERIVPVAMPITMVSTIIVLGVLVVAAGPNLAVVAVFLVQLPLLIFVLYQTRFAVLVASVLMAVYAVALSLVDGVRAPGWHVVIVGAAAGGTAVLLGRLARRMDEARAELADLNRHLEQRVAEQVDELERVGQLRRFLSPQVADVVVTRGSEGLLEPHQSEVAVLFVDLRGFTRFTNSVDADTVVGVLGEYYAAVGTVLEAYGATIGGYDGDGIMAYLGDPIPRPDAAADGVAMARAVGLAVDPLCASWRAAGHDLGYGIGLAFGTATLGVVGFDGRFDYTPLGAVVNLAARLCADAAPGEIVIDASVRRATGRKGTRTRGQVELKGFDAPVPTFALVRS